MDRTFARSTRRRRRTLDGQWEFVTDPEGDGLDEGYPDSFPSDDADDVPVPCSWNALPAYGDYVGRAWYHRTLDLPESTAVVLTFQGVGHDATVYLDGEEILSHTGGYTPFSTYVRELDAGSHDLVVSADNSPDESALLHDGTEWFPQGGIYREVVVEEIADVWVSDLDLEYELDGDEATVAATVTAHNVSPTPSEGRVVVSVGDSTSTAEVEVAGLNARVLDFELTVDDVDRWTLDDPTLYDVVVAVTGEAGSSGDDVRERLGFRDVAVDGRDVLINGDPVPLRGVDFREDHPDWGHAQPLRVQDGDVEAIRDAGFNTVRCADYPPHPRFLDRCDEVGLLVIEGISPHGAAVSADASGADAAGENVPDGDVVPDRVAESIDDEEFVADGTTSGHGSGGDVPSDVEDATGEARRILTEMVHRDGNHPSVVGWNLGTERAGAAEGMQETVSQLRETISGLDRSRLVTTASSADRANERASVFRFADVLCVDAGSRDGALDDLVDRVSERYLEKPIVLTGVGSAAVPGERSLRRRSGSESRQATELTAEVEAILDDDAVSGFSVQRYCDSLVQDGESSPTTAYTGILTDDRRPKEAYTAVRQLLDERQTD